MKIFTSMAQKRGEIGEKIATEYLCKRGFTIIDRNYTEKTGEIDIIATKSNITHFVEIKSVSCENFQGIRGIKDRFRPEDQMHGKKHMRLKRVISSYIRVHSIGEWQFDLICVYLDFRARLARIEQIDDLIL